MSVERRDILSRILQRIREVEPTITEEKLKVVEAEIRTECGGGEHYITKNKRTNDIKKNFNGRNIEEISEQFNVHRSTIYRALSRK